jgi:hypothetical protein
MIWPEAGRSLRRLREKRGWEVPRFAVELEAQAKAIGRTLPKQEHVVRMVYDWEAGTHRPRDYCILFVLVYATQYELAARTMERGSELDRLMGAFKAMGMSLDRRQFLLGSAALAVGAVGRRAVPAELDEERRLAWVVDHPSSVDLRTAAHLRRVAADLLARNEATSPAMLLPLAMQHLAHTSLLREHAEPGRVRQELHVVEALSATLTGRVAWNVSGQRDHKTATHYYEQAIGAAGNVKEGWVEAFPRMFQGTLAMFGRKDLDSGVGLVEKAAALAGDGSSHVLAGWASAFAGEGYALRGRERQSRLAIERATLHMTKATADDPFWELFGVEQLGGFIGVNYLHLGDPKRAQPVLEATAAGLGGAKLNHKSVVLSDLAIALIGQDHPEHATAVLHDAIDLVEYLHDGGGTRRAFMAGRKLWAWRNEPFVQSVHDRLLALATLQ